MIKNYQSKRELNNDALKLLAMINSCETMVHIDRMHSFMKKAQQSCENIILLDPEIQIAKKVIVDFLMAVTLDKLSKIKN